MTALRRRAALAAAACGALLALLLAAEGAARLAAPGRAPRPEETEFIDRSLGYLQPCFRRAGGRLVETNAGLPGPGRRRSIPRARTPGVPRVAVVGESSGGLLGQSLEALLARAPCGRRYELLECAIPGSGLEHLERRFDEVMGDEPDAVVVVFGHNLRFRFPTDALALRARRLRNASRLLTLLGGLFDPPPRGSNAPLGERLPAFERFLQRAAREGRARRVPVVVTTVASNLWMPPASYPTDRDSPALLGARWTEAASGPRAAADRLAAAPADSSAVVHFERGVLLARAGDPAAAGELEGALALDSFATRAAAPVNDLIRRVGAREGLAVRDTQRVTEELAPRHLPGWESFWDNCHLRRGAFDREAGAIFELLRPALRLPSACPAPPPPPEPDGQHGLRAFFEQVRSTPPDQAAVWYRAAALRVESRYLAEPAAGERDVAQYLQAETAPSPAALAAVAEGAWRAQRPGEALRLNERARSAGDAAAWVQLGVFRLREGRRAEARDALDRALALDPQRPDARSLREFLGRDR